MERKPVSSTAIKSIGRDGDVVEVEYHNGRVFRHVGVPADVFDEVMGGDSIGSAFNRLIKNGGYDVEPVEKEKKDDENV